MDGHKHEKVFKKRLRISTFVTLSCTCTCAQPCIYFWYFYVKTASKRFQVKHEKTLQNDHKSHGKPRNQAKLNKKSPSTTLNEFRHPILSSQKPRFGPRPLYRGTHHPCDPPLRPVFGLPDWPQPLPQLPSLLPLGFWGGWGGQFRASWDFPKYFPWICYFSHDLPPKWWWKH